MRLALGIPLVLLVLTTDSTPLDDLQWRTTLSSAVDASTLGAELATSSATLLPTYVTSIEALQTAALENTYRLPDAMEEESPDYYDDQAYEAASAGDQSCTATGTARVTATEYEAPDYYDDEPYMVSSGDGPHPTSAHSDGVTSTATRATAADASRGKNVAESRSQPTVSWREESRATAVVSGREAAPEPTNWISWLPVWCRDWPLYGPLGVPREMQLQAFAEALVEYTVGIENYWLQTAEPAHTDEQPSTEQPPTHLVSVVVHQVEVLQEFYQWMYRQLNITEPNGDSVPESLHRFLDALHHHTAMVKSICHWSPSMRLTCNAPDAEVLRNFFWALDRQLIWVHVLHNWAANQYNLTAGPRRNASWWLPFSLNESAPFNVSYFSTWDQTAGDSTSGLEVISSSSACTAGERDVMVGNENSEDLSSEVAAHGNYFSDKQMDQQEPHGEGKLPSCVLESISRGHETEQFTGTETIPVGDSEPELSAQEGGDELEAADAPSPNGMDSDDGADVDPDESIYEDPQVVVELEERMSTSVVVEEHGEEQEDSSPPQIVPNTRNVGVCSQTSVTQDLGPDFYPSYLEYVRCDEKEDVCEPPEKCSAVSSVVSLTMLPWASFPEFPHTYMGVRELPNGNFTVSLLVATSCACIEPLTGN